MKVLIISDSHGKGDRFRQIVERVNADHVIHCGDFCTDQSELPHASMTLVKGNCDWEEAPLERTWERNGFHFFVTHGHRYRVKETLLPLKYQAEEVGAHIVCFGHSHVPFCEKSGRILYINPGSISHPRLSPAPTYVVMELGEAREVHVRYYQVDGKWVREKGGLFTL